MSDHHPSPGSPSTSDIVEAGHRGDIPLIQRGLASSEPRIRAKSLSALFRAGALDPEQLVGALGDPASVVRRRAAELAARLEQPHLTETALVSLLDDEPELAEIAAFTLGEIGSRDDLELSDTTIAAIEHQVRHHDDALCRESAVAALGALHTGLDTILAACGDKATVRRRAVIALAPFDGPEVDAALQTALSDRDWQVRQAAEDQLGSANEDDEDDEAAQG